MTNPSPLAFATRAVHGGAEPDPSTGARAMPIFQTNGFVFEDQAHGADVFAMRRQGFSYSRGSNPTVAALERRIASLEGGTAGVALASGQSAWLVALLTLCATGEEYVGSSQVFGGSLGLMKRLDKRLNVKCAFAEPTPERIAAAITQRTRAIVIEAVVNPTGEVVDLDGIAEVAKAHNLPFVVDSTLASPALLRPIEHGADIVIHSASKFLVGNGTAIGGLIVDAGTFPWQDDTRFPLIAGPWEDYENYRPGGTLPAKRLRHRLPAARLARARPRHAGDDRLLHPHRHRDAALADASPLRECRGGGEFPEHPRSRGERELSGRAEPPEPQPRAPLLSGRARLDLHDHAKDAPKPRRTRSPASISSRISSISARRARSSRIRQARRIAP